MTKLFSLTVVGEALPDLIHSVKGTGREEMFMGNLISWLAALATSAILGKLTLLLFIKG
jgi:hypothetical protein